MPGSNARAIPVVDVTEPEQRGPSVRDTLTRATVKAIREAFSLGLHDIGIATEAADTRYGGDLLVGLGHVECSAHAVFRGHGEARERSVSGSAREWAERHRGGTRWASVLDTLPEDVRVETKVSLKMDAVESGIGRRNR